MYRLFPKLTSDIVCDILSNFLQASILLEVTKEVEFFVVKKFLLLGCDKPQIGLQNEY